jgi:gluconolactonase
MFAITRIGLFRAGRAALFAGVSALAVSGCALSKGAAQADMAAAAAVPAEGASILRLDPALDALIAPGAVVEKIAGGMGFVEGPVWTNGEIWFSDLTGNRLHAVGADGRVRLVMEGSGGVPTSPASPYHGSNGATVDRDGSVLLAQHGARRIVRVSRDLTVTPVLERDDQGRRLNSPNDMVFGPDGALWFTDPPLGMAGFDADPGREIPFNGVYRWKDGKLTAVITDLHRPNGIALSPDGRRLYVSNSGPDMFINVYDVQPDGAVANGRRLIAFPGPNPDDVPDGMKVDSLGNIWATGPGGIRILTPEGKVLGQIRTPDMAQANISWGGPDWRTAYITASTNVYRLRLATPGLRPLYGD